MNKSRLIGVTLFWLVYIASIIAFAIFQVWWILIIVAFFTECIFINKGYVAGYANGFQHGYKEGRENACNNVLYSAIGPVSEEAQQKDEWGVADMEDSKVTYGSATIRLM
jgi:hypothetical protein